MRQWRQTRQMRHFLFMRGINSLGWQKRAPGSKNRKSVAFCHTDGVSRFEHSSLAFGGGGSAPEGPEDRQRVAQGARSCEKILGARASCPLFTSVSELRIKSGQDARGTRVFSQFPSPG